MSLRINPPARATDDSWVEIEVLPSPQDQSFETDSLLQDPALSRRRANSFLAIKNQLQISTKNTDSPKGNDFKTPEIQSSELKEVPLSGTKNCLVLSQNLLQKPSLFSSIRKLCPRKKNDDDSPVLRGCFY